MSINKDQQKPLDDLFPNTDPGRWELENHADIVATFPVLVVTLTTTVDRVCTKRRPASRIARNDERKAAF